MDVNAKRVEKLIVMENLVKSEDLFEHTTIVARTSVSSVN